LTGNIDHPVIVIGAGYTGLSAAFELARHQRNVIVLEADDSVGGLAGSFSVGGNRLEKFYHHWFTSDRHVHDLVHDLGLEDQVIIRPTRSGSYYANTVFRLSKPLDLLKYTPLSFLGRLRLGFLLVQAKLVRDWRKLENMTASEWLQKTCGTEVYRKVWQPLLRGKFGQYADEVSAVWFWGKLVLRGASRSKSGDEMLAYYRGGFAALADALAEDITQHGGEIRLRAPVTRLVVDQGQIVGVETPGGMLRASSVIATVPLPIYRDLVRPHVKQDYTDALDRMKFIGNVCLTLELDRSLSDTYWINVVDPEFPFVGVIEHTNFEPVSSYSGRHIVYLSKYLPTSDALYRMNAQEFLDYATPYIQRMFPNFDSKWITDFHLYKADYSQPVVGKHHSALIPSTESPIGNLWLSTMAQIYPEDRGTNYAIREGRKIGRALAGKL